MPNFSDQEAIQKFFLHEVQLGEELLATGDIENGVEHLSMAVAVGGQPFTLLGKKIYEIWNRLKKLQIHLMALNLSKSCYFRAQD